MSEIIVAKAGGTSNRNAEAVRESMAWAEQSDIFVVSAPGTLTAAEATADPHMNSGKVTNMLLGARTEYRTSGAVSGETTDMVTDRYWSILKDLGKVSLPINWVDKIAARIEEAARHSEDAVSMLGERLIAEIYESFGYTMLDPGMAPHNLNGDEEAWRGWLDTGFVKGQRYVLPGNTTLVNGRLETFSRGGSDTSSGYAAYGVNADVNWNLTDDSALSADPRLGFTTEQLVRIGHLLYEEGRELGRNGTGLVHPAAMVPLKLGNIPTLIRSTSDRNASATLMDNDYERAAREREGQVVALSLMNDVVMHRVYEPGMAEPQGRLAAFETALAASNVPLIDSQGDGVDSQTYFVDSAKADVARQALEGVTRRGEIESTGPVSCITLVGYRLDRRFLDHTGNLIPYTGLSGEEWQAAGHDFSKGRHSLRISVKPEEALQVLQNLHRHLIETR